MAASKTGHRDISSGASALASLPGVEHITGVLHYQQAAGVGNGADGVPIRAVATQIRGEDRLGTRPDHGLDASVVKLVCISGDIHKDGYQTRLHHGGYVGGERQRRGDDLVASLKLEKIHRYAQSRRAAVDHESVLLGQERGGPFAQTQRHFHRCRESMSAVPRRRPRSRGSS